jgi:hypothetical protein
VRAGVVAGSKRFRRLPHVRFPARRPGPGGDGDGDGGSGPAASRDESSASSDQWTNRFGKVLTWLPLCLAQVHKFDEMRRNRPGLNSKISEF